MTRLSGEIRKEQIKEAVLDIIYQEGLRRFTTKRLAARIGISEAAIFRHFASKHDIFLDILDDVDEQLVSMISAIEQEELPARSRLQKIVCRTIHYYIRNKGITILILSEIAEYNDQEFRSRVQSSFRNQRQVVERVAGEGIRKGEINPEIDPKALSLLFMGIPVGIHLELILNPSGFTEEGFCENMSRTFLQACINPSDSISSISMHNEE